VVATLMLRFVTSIRIQNPQSTWSRRVRPSERRAAKQRGLADKYNRPQSKLGKMRTKSSSNLRFPTRFSGLLAGRAIGLCGTSMMPVFGSVLQLGH
jgi:hypothetical protein